MATPLVTAPAGPPLWSGAAGAERGARERCSGVRAGCPREQLLPRETRGSGR